MEEPDTSVIVPVLIVFGLCLAISFNCYLIRKYCTMKEGFNNFQYNFDGNFVFGLACTTLFFVENSRDPYSMEEFLMLFSASFF